MKLTDAAIWDIELGSSASSPPEEQGSERATFTIFEPAFASMPWLHKARLAVADVQHVENGQPSWMVLVDTEDDGVFLLLEVIRSGVVVSLVSSSNTDLEPGTQQSPIAWSVLAPIGNSRELVRAVGSSWGRGRRAII